MRFALLLCLLIAALASYAESDNSRVQNATPAAKFQLSGWLSAGKLVPDPACPQERANLHDLEAKINVAEKELKEVQVKLKQATPEATGEADKNRKELAAREAQINRQVLFLETAIGNLVQRVSVSCMPA
ncbi:MAG: hypothetical protein ABI612_20375 [Betaproteobacteria bacterium]